MRTETNGKAERNRRMAEMRNRGATLEEVGRRFGVSRERVRQILSGTYRRRTFRVRCRRCEADINPSGALPRDDGAALCLACLVQVPEATFGEHMQALRLAAGFKVSELASRAGVSASLINFYEHGRGSHPRWPVLLRLLRVFGILPVRSVPNRAG